MVAAGALAHWALVATLAMGADVEPALVTPADPPSNPEAEIESSGQNHMQVCESGGTGASECDVTCRKIFNFYTSNCGVTCASGYFACCSCDDGCHCLMDHEEMWPIPEPRPRI